MPAQIDRHFMLEKVYSLLLDHLVWQEGYPIGADTETTAWKMAVAAVKMLDD